MSKKEIINKMIEEGKSFEEIVVESGAAQSYVKSCFTKVGKDWEDYDAEGIELKTVIIKEGIETEEVADEDIPEDAEVLEEGIEIEEVECSELIKKTEEAYAKACKAYKSIEARILKTVLDDLKSENLGKNQAMIRRTLKMHVRSMLQKRMFAKTVEITEEYFALIK